MADILISYSKRDWDLALKLSAFLEAEGWSVWWDRNLSAGETYRDEIREQLAVARAVITIWTENSIKSDWVRAEAGQAKAAEKLIPVKIRTLGYSDIPLPFGEMHTENIDNTALIRAAVVGQLARPSNKTEPLALSLKVLRFQILTWIGIVGGTITLFSSLRSIFDLADWARRVVTHWHDWTSALWSHAFRWLGISISGRLVPLLSFSVFTLMLLIGTRLKIATERKTNQQIKLPEDFRRSLPRLMKWLVAYLICLCILYYVLPKYDPSAQIQLLFTRAALLIAWITPYMLLIIFSEDRLQVTITSVLLVIFICHAGLYSGNYFEPRASILSTCRWVEGNRALFYSRNQSDGDRIPDSSRVH